MARILKDRVKETTTTSGTGTYALAGAAAGYQAFSAVCANNDTIYYTAEDGTDWEVGFGTWTTGNNLARTTILASSNANAAVSWSGASKNIFGTMAALNIQPSSTVKIVAPSGGDYTTVGAAVAAASNGWTIQVMPGTYTETTLTSSLTNITIIGMDSKNTTLSIGTTVWTFSGADFRIENMGLTASTGRLSLTGTRAVVRNCYMIFSGNNASGSLDFEGNYILVEGNFFSSTANPATRTTPLFFMGVTWAQILDNEFKVDTKSTTLPAIDFSAGQNISFVGNTLESIGNKLGGIGIECGGLSSYTGNTFYNFALGSLYAYIFEQAATKATITGNSADGGRIRATGAGTVISGNQLTHNGTDANTGAVELSGGNMLVSGNHFRGNGSAGNVCVYSTTTCSNNIVTGNNFHIFDTAIYMNAVGVTQWNITDNIFDTITTTNITDAGFMNQALNNTGALFPEEKKYIYAKNTSGGTLNRGDCVVWKAVAAGNEITTTTTAGDNKVFGMVDSSSIANNASGFIQVLGKTVSLKANGTVAISVGDYLTTFTSAGIVAKAVATNMVIAIALEAYSTADSNGVLDAILITPRLI